MFSPLFYYYYPLSSPIALYCEGGPPVDIADRLSQSLPHLLLEGGMAQRTAQAIVDDQKSDIPLCKILGINECH